MNHDDHDHFQGPGRGHPWTGDRNRAEFPVSAWEVSTSIIFAIIIMIIVIAIIIIIIVTFSVQKRAPAWKKYKNGGVGSGG